MKSLCVLCRGTKALCGKNRCPVLVRARYWNQTRSLIDSLELNGSSPPGVFVGRYGYPKVFVGPLIPPIHGDTSLLDTPELWVGKTIDDIVGFRSSLIRTKVPIKIEDTDNKIAEIVRDISLAGSSIDLEATLLKKPFGRVVFSDSVQPLGPSAPLKSLDLSTIKLDQKMERRSADTDLKANPAVIELYKDGIEISRIEKSFSTGSYGLKRGRKLVPTRWAITAVDDIISKSLREKIKEHPTIDEYRVYRTIGIDNRWFILMMPLVWMYELIEAWYPNTTWNLYGGETAIYNSAEGYEGRKKYAEIGGCYYAARLAVTEKLLSERRQAAVLILREAHPGYIMPVGVWNVREHVRDALKKKYQSYDSLDSALEEVMKVMDIPLLKWIENSSILGELKRQRRLEEFIGDDGI